MNTENGIQENVDNLTDDAKGLLAAGAEFADQKLTEARNRLAAAMDAAKQTYAVVQKKTAQGAKATDRVIRENPYQALGVAFAVGALVGFLLSRRND